MSLYVQESFVNKTEGYRIGESDVYETRFDTPSDLYRSCLREYGRCTGKVYVTRMDGATEENLHVGWTFLRSEGYEDDPEKRYLREVWVTVHDGPPERSTSYRYRDVGKGGGRDDAEGAEVS